MGKTQPSLFLSRVFRKHPHERGEDSPVPTQRNPQVGNTPTSVGKTESRRLQNPLAAETPPRAWGRQSSRVVVFENEGNTPTSVGKTAQEGKTYVIAEKHPHERGEDVGYTTHFRCFPETPPRAWGRHWILLVLTGGWWRFVLWLYLFFNHKGHA